MIKKCWILTIIMLLTINLTAQNIAEANKRDALKLTIHYLFAADSTMAADKYENSTMLQNSTYSVPSPIIPNYHPSKDTVQGTMPNHDVEDTVFYTINKHNIEIAENITNGTLTTEPNGEVQVGNIITITATPNTYFELISLSAFNKHNPTQTLNISDTNTLVMPDFDVVVTADFIRQLPTIVGEIDAPNVICSGETLQLTLPQVLNCDTTLWQIAADDNFTTPITYEGQELNADYNGWRLRLVAKNETGNVFSNIVEITVSYITGLTLNGDNASCTNQTSYFKIEGLTNHTISWTVNDDDAVVAETADGITVLWNKKGTYTVTADVTNEYGCTEKLSTQIDVMAFVDEDELNEIVAKKHNGKAYLLIYPNPKEVYKYQWYKNNEAIEDAQGQYYYPEDGLASGDYKVYVSLNSDSDGRLVCGAFSQTISITNERTCFAVYPNPASTDESIYIDVPMGTFDFEIYTTDGRRLWNQTINNTTSIAVNLPAGVYVARLSKDGEVMATSKVVVK